MCVCDSVCVCVCVKNERELLKPLMPRSHWGEIIVQLRNRMRFSPE